MTVSILIVNYNGRSYLPECLGSVSVQEGVDTEVILVDNGSTDGSVEYVRNEHPAVTVVESDENRGFAGGNNLGLEHASGEYVLLLNTDAYLQPGSLREMVSALDAEDGPDVIQPKIALTNDRGLDASGAYFTHTGFLNHVGLFEDPQSYDDPFDVYSVKGACMMTRRSVVDEIGLFDDDYFMYFEESDFCHRAWLAGYRCAFVPTTTVEHEMGGTSGDDDDAVPPNLQYHSYKNRIRTYLKNLGWRRLAVVLPLHLSFVLLLAVLHLVRGQTRHCAALLQSIWWNVSQLPSTVRRRREIQREIRTTPDSAFLPAVTQSPDVRQYIGSVKTQFRLGET